MRGTVLLLVQVLLFSCISSCRAQVNFTDLSPCTLSCLLETFSAANCSLTDTTCQCQDEPLKESTTHCMLSNCSLEDSFALGNLQAEVCGFKPESRQHAMLVVNVVTSSLAIFAILLRLASRWLVSKRIWADDIVITVAGFLLLPFSGLGIWMIQNGLGTHTWTNPIPTVVKILQLFWIDETFYILVLMLTKISILLFYLRVFPSRGFQLTGYTVLGFVALSGTIILLCQLLQCLPVQFNWDKSIEQAKCLNVNALGYAHAAFNIFQDVLILALPIPWILRLKLQLYQKIGLVFMFQVGAFACITAAVRLHFLAEFGGTSSTDPLWENADSTMWTAGEVNSAILCACLPAIRALYKTGRKMASQHSSQSRSLTVLSGNRSGRGLFSANKKSSATDTTEEHRLDLAEEWNAKDTEADRRHGPITFIHREPVPREPEHTAGKGPYLPRLKEEPEPEVHYASPSAKYISIESWVAGRRQ